MKGLYIHIPFCAKKCRYCDFVSYTGCGTRIDGYLEALREEMKEYCGERVDTVFIGGGTPSLLTRAQLKRLILLCFEMFDVQKGYEFTVEANPGTLTAEKTETMLSCGVNRISVGVQSLNADELRLLGRIHDSKTAYNTVRSLSEAGFSNINADIMTGLPFQTKEKLRATVDELLSLPLTHISAYSLIPEENTPLKAELDAGRLALPEDDEDREMYAMVRQMLADRSFCRYEISNFARKGFECRHNIKYWECEEYIGIGVSASSYVNRMRYKNTHDLNKYCEGIYDRETEHLTARDMTAEFMFLGLRMDKGVSLKEFKRRFGADIHHVYGRELEKFIKSGFLIIDGDRCRLSERGIDVSNMIMCEFI